MESGMPDYGFGRCDGHHKMIDFKLEKGNGTAASWISVCGECGGRGLRAGCAWCGLAAVQGDFLFVATSAVGRLKPLAP
jgi:hypothetical protein